MKTTTQLAAVSLAVLGFALAGAVSAHPGYGMGPGAGMGPGTGAGPCMGAGPGAGPGMGMGMGPGMHGRGPGAADAAAVGARFDALKAEIKITAAQEAAWQAYVTVVQQQVEQRQALRTQMQAQMHDPQAAATVDRAAHYEAMSKVRETHLAARQAALNDLFAVLSPEQKALAEQRLAPGAGHRMAMRGWGR